MGEDEPLQIGDIVWINYEHKRFYEIMAFTDNVNVILCETYFDVDTLRYWSHGSWAAPTRRFYAETHHLIHVNMKRGVVIYE